MHGRGVFKFSNGEIYDGEYKEDLKHGPGVYKYANGNMYEG